MSREYIVVHRIDKDTPLDEHIPLHMTALHWFEFDQEPGVITEQLRQVAADQSPVTTYARHEDLFGPDNTIPVMRLERTPELLKLHTALEAAMRQVGVTFEERWVGEKNWNPHVTHQPEGRLQRGSEVTITDLDLIIKREDGMRELISRVALGAR